MPAWAPGSSEVSLKAGAALNAARKDGCTPLYGATENGHPEMVEYPATAGAFVNAATMDDFTPLYIAAGNGHLEIVMTELQLAQL